MMNQNERRMESKDIPLMFVQYCLEGRIMTTEVSPSYAYWKYKTEDDLMHDIISENLHHPMDIVNLLTRVEVPYYQRTVSFLFSLAPDSYTVRFWPDRYAGMRETYYTKDEERKVYNNTILLPHEEPGYVFQVQADWGQGNGNFEFHLTYLR